MGGAVLSCALTGSFAYIILKAEQAINYNRGYMDGMDDANKINQSLKQK